MAARYPGVTRLPDGRVQIRWTVRLGGRKGRTVNRRETLPEMPLADAARIRSQRAAETVQATRTGVVDQRASFRAMTLTAYARRWLEQRAASLKSATTVENWIDALEHHILPVLGSLQIGRIRRDDVQGWVAHVEAKTFVPRTARPRKVRQADGTTTLVEPEARTYAKASIASWWTKLRQLLKDAAADAEVPDPTLRVQPPKATGRRKIRERRTLSVDELRSLLDGVPTGWHAEVAVCAATGVRPGELYALEWERDVDLERGRLRIEWSQVRGTLTTTKTDDPRTIPVGAELVEILRAHRRTMVRNQHPGVGSGLVFPASARGDLADPDAAPPAEGWYRLSGSLLKTLVRAARSVGLEVRVTPQVLRRTWVSLQVESGIDRLVLRSIVGHVDEEMTERYHHAREELRLAAVRNLGVKVLSPVLSRDVTAPATPKKKPRNHGA